MQIVLFLILLMLCWTRITLTVTLSTNHQAKRQQKDHQPTMRITPYPNAFRIHFVTNVTQDDASHPIINGTLYYDWSIPAQRIDHPAGSYECVHFYNTHQPCSLVFLASGGMYRLLLRPNDGADCCLDLPGLGPPPPDWASASNNNNLSTYNGLVYDRFSQRSAHMWSFDKNVTIHAGDRSSPLQQQQVGDGGGNRYVGGDYHTMRQVAEYGNEYGRPLVFTFPGSKANGRQDFHYQVETMVIGPQHPLLFQLPHGCANKACG
jgi:hypothetical protein